MSTDIRTIAGRLWDVADKLRANTHLRASEYSVPVLGLIFLKFADQKFAVVEQRLRAQGRQELTPAHYKAEGAIYLHEQARFGYLRGLSRDVSGALNNAMRLIESENESLRGSLPTNAYTAIDDVVLKPLLVTFDGLSLDIEGDIFGKIYEYFLGEFAMSEGQRGGELDRKSVV